MTDRRAVVIIGMGNPMRRDDGVGHAAIAMLEHMGTPESRSDVDMLRLDGEATRLIEAWRGRTLAIVVDAARAGERPGTIHRLEVGVDELPTWSGGASSHSTGLAEAIDLAGALRRLPDKLVVYGVEPADMSMGEGLTPAVQAAVRELAARVTVERSLVRVSRT